MTAKELNFRVPRYSCPSFDAAIKEIELARGTNSELRTILELALSELQDAEARIKELEKLTGAQQDQIQDMRAELAGRETP